MMKHASILAAITLSCACNAAEVVLEEKFEEVSDNFVKNVYFNTRRSVVENVPGFSSGENSLVADFTDVKTGYPMVIKYPKTGTLNTDGCIYKISFDYKILSYNGTQLCVAAIQRHDGQQIINDDASYFGGKTGQKGKITLYSAAAKLNADPMFFISTRDTASKIAIDNFKVEKIKAPSWLFEKDVFFGVRNIPFSGKFFGNNPQLLGMTKQQFFPFIDRWGQFIHKEWPNKVHSDEDLKKRTQEEENHYEKLGPLPATDKYFGYINPKYKFEATGRFRTQKVNGKWFFITPEGNLFWSLGVNSVALFSPTPIDGRQSYFADSQNGGFDKEYITTSYRTRHLYKEPHRCFKFEERNLDLKYGKQWPQIYSAIVEKRMSRWGINTYGGFSWGKILTTAKAPFAYSLNSVCKRKLKSKTKIAAYWSDVADYFDPAFLTDTISLMKKSEFFIKNPYCMGVFIDNELSWQTQHLQLARAIVQSPADQPAKLAFRDMLKAKYKDIKSLNDAWKSDYKDFSDFLSRDDFQPKTKAAEADLRAIEIQYYQMYFKTCRQALKSVDENALYISCRFAWSNDLVRTEAARYADIVAYNWYKDAADNLSNPEGAVDKPIIVGEYHFCNLDAGVFGGGLRPYRTMKGRIKANNNYVNSALDNPRIVGVHWFRWSDQIASGRDNDGENFCSGLVDICDTPVYEFVDSLRELAKNMYNRRLNGAAN